MKTVLFNKIITHKKDEQYENIFVTYLFCVFPVLAQESWANAINFLHLGFSVQNCEGIFNVDISTRTFSASISMQNSIIIFK